MSSALTWKPPLRSTAVGGVACAPRLMIGFAPGCASWRVSVERSASYGRSGGGDARLPNARPGHEPKPTKASRPGRRSRELLSNVVERRDFLPLVRGCHRHRVDDGVCRCYQLLYATRSVASGMSASGLYASGRSTDLRLFRTHWSTPVVLERTALDLGYWPRRHALAVRRPAAVTAEPLRCRRSTEATPRSRGSSRRAAGT